MLTRLEEFKIETTNQLSVICATLKELCDRVKELEDLLYDDENGEPDSLKE